MASTFGLAPFARLCLIGTIQARAAQRASGPAAASKAALAGLMALLLLAATLVSVSHALHQSLHRDGSVGAHFCLVCSFAKGQVTGHEGPLALALAVLSLLFCILLAKVSPVPGGLDYCVSRGRAPPVR